MVDGSFATATNASPMPTARAPTPILRKLPPVVPTRSLPTPWERASPGRASRARTSTSRLEVIVDSDADPQRRADVRGVRQDRVDLVLRRTHVLALAFLRLLARRRVDPLDDLPVEQVLG